MKRHCKWIAALAACLVASPSLAAEPDVVVRNFVDAYNRQDLDALVAHTDPSVRWMFIVDGELSTETEGQAALRTALASYFDALPSAMSEIVSMQSNGSFVSTVEKAIWTVNGERREQCALAVYELEGSRIVNVWYYRAEACPGSD